MESSPCHTREFLRRAGRPVVLVADMVPVRSSRALPGPRELWIGPGLSPDGDHRLGRQEVRDVANGWTHQEMGRGTLISP